MIDERVYELLCCQLRLANADGNEIGSNTFSDNVPAHKIRPSKKKEIASRVEKARLKVDKVIVYAIEDYYQLPVGTKLMNRNGMPDVWEYKFIEYVRAHSVEYVYKVARVKFADGTFTGTVEHPLKKILEVSSLRNCLREKIPI